ADGNAAFVEQLHGEVNRAHLSPGFRNLRPDEHAGFGSVDVPAESFESIAEGVAARLVFAGNGLDSRIAVTHCDDGRDLRGLKDSVIVITLDGAQRADHFRVAAAEAN